MNYALAKELKEAGFPFSKKCEYAHDGDDGLGECAYCDRKTLGHGSNAFLLPTLEELIEACGERFGSLDRDVGCPSLARTQQGMSVLKMLADAWSTGQLTTNELVKLLRILIEP